MKGGAALRGLRSHVSRPGPPTPCSHPVLILSAKALLPENVHREGQPLPPLHLYPAPSLATISGPVVEGFADPTLGPPTLHLTEVLAARRG